MNDSRTATRQQRDYLDIALVLPGLAIAFWYNFKIFPWMLDDAFISFRYSLNFSEGNGLVYNVGEQVEGYTSFLWVFLLGLGGLANADIVFFAKLLGVAFGIGSILVLVLSKPSLTPFNNRTGFIASLLLCSSGGFSYWFASGMEVTLYSFLILTTLVAYIRAISEKTDRRLATVGVFLALTAMTRPEGALLVMLLFGDAIWRLREGGVKYTLTLIIPAAVLYLPFFAWRFSYYGYLFPNTFYAKVGSSLSQLTRGLSYTGDFLIVCLPLILLAGWALYKVGINLKCKGGYLIAAFILMQVAYVISVGGDIMPAFRFYAPILPLLAFLAAKGITASTRKSFASVAVTFLIVAYSSYQSIYHPSMLNHIESDRVAYNGKIVGLWLKSNVPESTILATNAAGAVPYYSKLTTIDMLGLNDEHIAHRDISDIGSGAPGHEKGDGAYVLSRRPDMIQFFSSIGSLNPAYRSDIEITEIESFSENYTPAQLELPNIPEPVTFYVRNEFASQIK